MTLLIGGAETGLQNTTLNLLGRNDQPNTATTDNGDQIFVNVANGNLIYSHQDTYLPSRGEDYQFLRTYNSRAGSSDESNFSDARWAANTSIRLKAISEGDGRKAYEVRYGDGSVYMFRLDPATGLYVTTQGDGAYETLKPTVVSGKITGFVVTRADQSTLTFTAAGVLSKWTDTNGQSMTFTYSSGRLVKVMDDTGYTLTYNYTSSKLSSITTVINAVTTTLVRYTYDSTSSRLASVTDRYGHVTRYYYTTNGYLERIVLPTQIAGQGNGADASVREIKFEYTLVNWSGTSGSSTPVLTKMTDAMGNVTTFSYAFNLTDHDYKGVRTTVRDALGKVTTYDCNASGFITKVIDESLFETSYTYDAKGNLSSVTDRNGWGAANSDSTYYRELRESLGFARNLGSLSAGNKTALLAMFTRRFTYDARGNVLTSADNSGNTNTFTYTAFNKISSVQAPEGGITRFFYDAKQNLIRQVDAGGDTTRYTYDAYGNLTDKIVYLDRADAAKEPADVAAAKKQITHYIYDRFGNNTSTVDAEGFTTSGVYDPFGNLLEFTDARGSKYLYTYDKDNRLLTIRDPEGRLTTNTYDAVGNRVAVTTGWNNHTVTSVYDKNNRLITTIDPSTDAAKSRTIQRSYDVVGNQTSIKDAEGRTTTYAYSARRELIEIKTAAVDDDGNAGTAAVRYTGTIAYDGDGNRIAVTDNRGNTTSYQYTRDGLLRLETRADGQITQYSYDRNQNLLSVVAGMQLELLKRQTTTYAYDAEEQLVRVTDAKGNFTAYAYDAPGNMVEMTDAEGRVSRMSYDRNNQLRFEVSAEVTDPVTGLPTRYTVEHRFDGNGNEIETIDQNDKSTLFAFDKVDRTTSVTDANGIVTTFGYDGNDNVTRVEIRGPGAAEAASVSTYVYDEFNQLLAETDGVGNALVTSDAATYQTLRKELGYTVTAGGLTRAKLVSELTQTEKTALLAAFTTRYTYDKVGNLKTETDKLGRTTSFEYDALDRMVRATDAMGGTQQYRLDTGTGLLVLETAVSGTRQYRYDGNGNLLSETDELGRVTTYTYDTLGRVATRSDPLGSGTATTLSTFVYDSFGNLDSRTEASGTTPARTTRYEYDLNNLLTATIEPGERKTSYSYDRVGNRISMQDARGNSVDYSYDALDRVIKMRDPLSNEVKFEYDGVGNTIAIVNARGTRTRMEFDPGNRMTQMTDGEGRITRFSFDALGNTITVTTGAGTSGEGSLGAETTRYEYDAESNLRAVVDADNQRSTFGFDRVYNETSATDARGNTTTTAFDALNRAVLVTDAEGGTTRYTYDKTGNALAVKDANGNVTRYAYDRANQLITETDALGVQTTYAYDAFGATTTITRAANRPADEQRIARMEYDEIGNLYKQIDQNNNFKQYTYDKNDNVTRITDENGHNTDYSYDENNRVTVITDHLGGETRFSYDANGNRTVVEDAVGNKTIYYYNANNELDLMVDALGYATAYTYDANGNRVAQTLHATAVSLPVGPGARPSVSTDTARDQATRVSYDALNRVTTMTDALNGVTRYTYDANGNRTVVEDANGNKSAAYYDGNNRLTLSVDALGFATTYVYDALGNLTATTQYGTALTMPVNPATRPVPVANAALDRTMGMSYDALNRVTAMTDALDGVTRYTYAANGNRTVVEDANRNKSTAYYDGNNRLTLSVDALGFATTYVYDAVGNLTATTQYGTALTMPVNPATRPAPVANAALDRTMGMSYDALNRVTTMTDALGFVTTYSYDAVGNRTVVEDAVGNKTTFYYNANNELDLMVDALGYATAYTYDANGNRVAQTLHATAVSLPVGPGARPSVLADSARDQTSRISYDALNRVTSVRDGEGGVTHSVYDAVGNLTEFRDPNGNPTRYTYDKNDRVTTITDALGGETSLSYDALGQILSSKDANQKTTSYVYDALGRVTKETDPEGGYATYAYDAVGNLKRAEDQNRNQTLYAYDELDRMVRMTDAKGFYSEFGYDAVGNRISMTDQRGNTTTYAFDALNRQVRVTNPEDDYMAYGYDAVGRLTSMDQNGDDTLLTLDALGRGTERTDAKGGVATITYDHAGNETSRQDESGVLTRFEYDRNNRLVATVDDSGKRSEFTYDDAGNLISSTDENGKTTHFGYDDLNRQVSETDPTGKKSTSALDGVGNVVSLKDMNDNAFHVLYDGNNRRIALLSKEGYLTQFDYDAAGNEIERREYNDRYVLTADGKIPGPNAGDTPRVTKSGYNTLNQLEGQTDPTGLTLVFDYDAAGNRIKTTQTPPGTPPGTTPDGLVVLETLTYDGNNRVVTRTDGTDATTTLTLDDRGNILTKTGGVGTPGERTTTYTYDELGRLLTETNALGRVISYTYDASDRMESRTTDGPDVAPRVERFHYDQNGRLDWQEDGVGTRTSYEYDAAGNTTKVTHAANKTSGETYSVRYEYDANNRLVAEIDGEGVRTEYVYDARGNKIETIQAKGVSGEQRSTVYAYDAQDRLISITNPESETTRYYYDAQGNQACIVDAEGGITFNTFDANGRILTNTVGAGTVVELTGGATGLTGAKVVTQGDQSFVVTLSSAHGGVTTTNTYDARGNVLSTSIGYADGTDVRTTRYEYDAEDQMTALTDAEGFTNRFEYDAFGNQTRITIGLYELAAGDTGHDADKAARAQPQTSLFFYDEADQLIKAIDGEGNVITNTYDCHGNKTSLTLGHINTDDTLGVVSDDEEHLSTTTYGYDLAGKLTRTETAEGGVLKVERDALGREKTISRLQSGTEAAGVWSTVRYERDCFGRTTRETDANGIVTTTAYDEVGNTTSSTRAFGTAMARTTVYEYDLMSRLVSQRDPLGGVTRWAYDDVGNLISITDAEGNIERSYYDEYNSLSGTVSATGLLTTFARDSAGNVLRTVQHAVLAGVPAGATLPAVAPNAGDRVFLQAFNGNNKRITETYSDGAVKRFEFDSCGLLISQTNSVATDDAALARTADKADRVMRWSWDASGRLVGFSNVDGVIETYTYDAANNRISTTIYDPNTLATGGTDADRITTYAYDDNNRVTVQTIGANLQELAYDKAGNVISKTDGRGSISRTVYDEGNRVLSLSDPKGGTVVYGYDAAGRLASLTDARGSVRSFLYDGNDRLIEERAPATTTFTIDGGFENDVGITRRTYDKVGNLISNTDAAGFRTQWWYDDSNRIVAEVNGDAVLRTYQYNAFGQVAAVSTDTVRANRAALVPSTVPTTSGPVATIRTEYDTRGRAVLTTLPSVDVTTVSGTGTSTSVQTQALTERSLYDGWGNLVESVDRAGKSSFAWYDTRGRQIASVDAAGFLIETHFDSQDHVVRQTKYTTALSGSSAGLRPVSPSTGNAYSIDRYYSAEGNLVREISPEVSTVDGLVRVETVFSYDAVGNMVSRTLAHGTAQAQTEHYYYDANNLRVAVVTAGRALATFEYDANGNTTEQRRYATRVADGVNLDSVTADDLVSGMSANVDDQVRSFTYDARNLQSTRTEQMGAGTADDVIVQSWYDANGNNTRKLDGERYETRLDCDASGRATRIISPDGAWSFVEYNTFGLKTRAWIGGNPDSRAPAAETITATLANGSAAAIGVNWDFAAGTNTNGLTAWIAWDTNSHANLSANEIPSKAPNAAGIYAYGSVASEDLESTAIPLSALTAGQTVYFRVMVQDSFGNLSWSAEQSVVVPPALQGVTVRQTGTDTFVIEADFSSAVSDPDQPPKVLVGGEPQDMVLVSGSRWSLSLTDVSDPAALLIGFAWTSGGQTYTSSTTDLLQAASAPQETGAPGWIEWHLPQQGAAPVGSTQLIVLDGALQPASASYRSNDTLQFDLPPRVAPATSQNYDIYYGNAVSEAHTLDISFKDMQNRVATGTGYNRNSDNEIVSTNYFLQWVSNNDNKVQTTIALGLDAAETDRISGDLQLSWRKQGSDGNFSDQTTAAMTKADNDFSTTLNLDESTVYDIKLWYTDTNGKEVIVGWRRFTTAAESGTTPAGSVTVTGTDVAPASATQTVAVGIALRDTDQHSMTVLAAERGGVISGATGSLQFTTGLYSGPVDAAALSAVLSTLSAGSAGEFQAGKLEGDAALFFTQIEYDALGRKIASNENNGLWSEYGLDANGNVVATRLLGDDRDATVSIDSFARFDARNLEVETIGPVAGGQAAITVTAYDYAGRIISVQDPGNDPDDARLFAYDSAASLVSETDALEGVTKHRYDLLGNLVRTEDPVGHVHVFEYTYTGADANRLTRSYYAGLESTTTETYGYDTFGRRTSMTKGGGSFFTTGTIEMRYDQLDRRVSLKDAMGERTDYEYDKRGLQTWVRDANENIFGNAYDAMGRLTHQYSFTERPPSFDDAKSWVASGRVGAVAYLVTQTTEYDVFGNRIASIDPMGRRNSFSYGAFGRLLTAGDTNFGYDHYGRRDSETGDGKSITRSYDAAGRLTEVNDIATATRTEYTYDAVGNRQTEKLWVSGALKRNQTYVHNARQELVQWTDTASGTAITQSYDYWADGNLKSVTNGSGVKNYTFDAADRITQAGTVSFSYDYAGNRASEGNVTYTYLKNGRLWTATPAGGATSTWAYDGVGNVQSRSDGTVTESNSYDRSAYRLVNTQKGSDVTRTTFDKSGRTLSTYVKSVNGDGKVFEFTYSYNYNADGQQVSVTASGTDSAYGTSTSQYDVNGRLVRVNRGAGDTEGSKTFSAFLYDNDGNIIERLEDGTGGGQTRYLYALGKPMGEYTDPATPTLNTGNYAALKTIATGLADGTSAFPDSSIIQHTVAPGDTLQSIAGQYYGSPDLWFVIAEANGLSGNAALEVGSRLVVPSTVQNAYHTAETHALYKEGDIVGSKLPNITTPPAKEDKCVKIGAIILIVFVAIAAIFATIFTVGAAAPAAAAALGFAAGSVGAIVVSVAVGAVIGAAFAFAASVATQAILVDLLNQEWDWNAVLADTLVGFLGGAAAGLGAAAQAAGNLSKIAKVANVIGQVALEAAGETASQAIQNNGQIVSPWLILAAGAGGALGGVGDVWRRGSQLGKVAKGAVEASEATADLARVSNRVTDASLSLVDDVAETARRAGRGRLGVFSDVARFQFAEMTGRAFTQTVVKGSDRYLTNLDEGKKIVRTFTKITDNASAVAEFKEVDRVGSLGKRITDGFDEFSDWARTSKTTVEGSKTNTRQVRVVVDQAKNDMWRGRGFDKLADLSKEERQALFSVKNKYSELVENLAALSIEERKALRSGPELGVEMRTIKGTKRVRTTVRGVDSYADVVRDSIGRTGKWERFRDPILGSARPFRELASEGLSNASASARAGLQRMGAAAGESVTNLRQSISKGVSNVRDLREALRFDDLRVSTLDDWMDSGRSRAWTTMDEPDVQALGTGKWERFSGGLRNASASARAGLQRMGAAVRESVGKGFSDLSDWAHTSKTTVKGSKTDTHQVKVVVDQAKNDMWRGRGFDKYADLSKEQRQALFSVKGDFAWSASRPPPRTRWAELVENLAALSIEERKALRSGPELGVEMRTVKGTKRVRTTVRGVSSYKDVVRESVARTGKWERFRDPIVAGLKNAVQSASSWLRSDVGISKVAYALQDFVVLPLEAYERNRAENESPDTTVRSAGFSWGGALRKGGKNLTALNKLGVFMPAAAPLTQMFANGMDRRGWDPSNSELSNMFTTRSQQKRLDAQAETARARFPYTDSDALRTYADFHERQHNYLALEWRSVAANTSTSMLSPFSRDRAAGVTSLMQSNRMVSGEVNGFDSASVVAFAEASVGGVGGDPSKTPGWFG